MNRPFLRALYRGVLLLFIFYGVSSARTNNTTGDSLKWIKKHFGAFDLYYTPVDSGIAEEMGGYISNGRQTVTDFFNHPFKKNFSVYLFPARNALDRQWQQDWGDPTFHSECWMVASGVADRLDILTPLKWETEACEHSFNNKEQTQKLLTHELVHVFHGQENPKPDFAGMDDLAWLIEGMATYASGQLTETRMAGVKSMEAEGKVPTELASFWAGKNKYGLAGSMMQYIDFHYGRSKLFDLLLFTDQQKVLSFLETNEAKLINDWKANLSK